MTATSRGSTTKNEYFSESLYAILSSTVVAEFVELVNVDMGHEQSSMAN
jgi:hypothetical protein